MAAKPDRWHQNRLLVGGLTQGTPFRKRESNRIKNRFRKFAFYERFRRVFSLFLLGESIAEFASSTTVLVGTNEVLKLQLV